MSDHAAFVSLTIKSLDDDARLIEGWATRPETDLVGDVVMPRGAVYTLPIPFLLDHDHKQAVGEVDRVEVTDKGIRFWAHIKKIAEPGEVKDLCDKAWSLIKNGLRRAVSIGFKAEDAQPNGGGGYTFTRWRWLELSAVSVPALPSAAITGAKGHVIGKTFRTIEMPDPAREAGDALRKSTKLVQWGQCMSLLDEMMAATKAHVTRRLDEVTGPLLDLVSEQATEITALQARLSELETANDGGEAA
ncbi:MAG: HK97 family phage prohead protease [Micropepsaceae bacterium]